MVCSEIRLFSSDFWRGEGLVCDKMLLEDICMGVLTRWLITDPAYSGAGDLICYLFSFRRLVLAIILGFSAGCYVLTS